MSVSIGQSSRPLKVYTRKVAKHFYNQRRIKSHATKKPYFQARIKNLFNREKPKRVKEKVDMLYRMHEKWFFGLDSDQFKALTGEYNEVALKIELQAQENYDGWLNYFKTLPPSTIRQLAKTGQDFIPTEGYAALSRWHDIISNPHRIDKIHQSGLTNPKGTTGAKSVSELALANDRLGVLKATRDKIAEKLDKGAGSRDTALLTREMTEIMTQIADYEKRSGPKKTTELGKLIDGVDEIKKKRPSRNGGGTRNTSFASRVTIKDLEQD